MITLRMSGLMGLGPLEENETTRGAITSFGVSLTRIVAIGRLKKVQFVVLIKTEIHINIYILVE